jgi:Ca-activated chloride channel family protein
MKTRFLLLSLVVAVCLIGCQSAPKNVTSVPEPAADYGFISSDSLERNAPPSSIARPDLAPHFGSAFRKESKTRGESASPLATYAGEELWIIHRPASETNTAGHDQYPGSGTLMTRVAAKEVPLPLKHTDVKANVTAYIASVDVTQQFENPYNEKVEAVYVFPLPENGAVNEFVMQIGQRRIRGIVRERGEAERIYREAKHQGFVASLMTQERPNIFTQSVANIEPGKQIDVSIRYYNTLRFSDGWYEFVFPMVVGPRFNPPSTYRGIGAVPASGLARSGQETDVHYLHPSSRSGHDISLALEVDAGVLIEEVECKTHTTKTKKSELSAGQVSVELDSNDSIPNKDFIFRYRVAGRSLKSSLLTHTDHRGGFFTLMLYPPATVQELERAPLELVFVLDCSGSMSGQPLAQAKSAIRWALKNMDSRDTFQLINFSVDARQFGREPVPATRGNLDRALKYLESLQSEGGTMMIEGVKAALDFPHDPSRLRFVCFLTDGFIGNESDILREVHQRLGESRIFSFGVGSSVNRFLIESMAKVGRGAVAYLGLNDSGEEVMQDFFERISHPALTDVKIDWKDLDVQDVYPKRLPDIFAGRPLVITGRFDGRGDLGGRQVIEVSGKAGQTRVRIPVGVKQSAAVDSTPALPAVWARNKIADLLERSHHDPSAGATEQIRRTALDYQLLSPFTAFLALDASRRTAGETATTVPVAVPVPDGVRYQTTVSE